MTPHLLLASACSALTLVAGSACMHSQTPDPWATWSVLQMKAKAAPLFRGRVEMRRFDDAGGRVLETTTTARFLGAVIARSRTTTRLDAATGYPQSHESYSRKRGRRYVFGEDGYSMEKLEPAKDDERDEGNSTWQVSYRKEFDYPTSEGDGTLVRLFDYYGMLLHLRELPLASPGDEATVSVATSGGPEAYSIRVSEARSAERRFTDLATAEETVLQVRELRLTISPADPDADEGFLNMVGDTEVWVEARSKTLLEIDGKIPKVPGRVRLTLAAMGS